MSDIKDDMENAPDNIKTVQRNSKQNGRRSSVKEKTEQYVLFHSIFIFASSSTDFCLSVITLLSFKWLFSQIILTILDNSYSEKLVFSVCKR